MTVDQSVRDRAARLADEHGNSWAAAMGALPAGWRQSILFHVRLVGSSPDRQRRALDRLPAESRAALRRWLAEHRDATPFEVMFDGSASSTASTG